MKLTFVFTAFLLSLAAFSTIAQTTPTARQAVQPKARLISKGATLKEGFVLKEGQVLRTQSGATNPLRADVVLPSGVKVAASGTLTQADGRTITLQEGDQVSPTGRFISAASIAAQDSVQRVAKEQAKLKTQKGKRK